MDKLLLGLDIGTTHCKAGLFDREGTEIAFASLPTLSRRAPEGYSIYHPDDLWNTALRVVNEVGAKAERAGRSLRDTASVGISSMAETGLLLDRQTGASRSAFLPWFETCSSPQAEAVLHRHDPEALFRRSGLHFNYKCGLAKILFLLEQDPSQKHSLSGGAVWLSVADYIAYRLTGALATDPSLAGRTGAYHIDRNAWDGAWLETFELEPSLFPPVLSSGAPAGVTLPGLGLPAGVPVSIAGHDHMCGAYAAGAFRPGIVFDSLGTAETLIGVMEEATLGEDAYTLGLLYSRHASGRLFWMGALSAAGGSIEWMRGILGETPLSYAEFTALLERGKKGPGEVIFLPYLTGRGAPVHDPKARGVFLGLSMDTSRADLAKAVVEGIVFEMEAVKRTAEAAAGRKINRFAAAGGGTRLDAWMQLKADVSGCEIELLSTSEASLLGAALLAGVGSGFYRDDEEVFEGLKTKENKVIKPEPDQHAAYRRVFEERYIHAARCAFTPPLPL